MWNVKHRRQSTKAQNLQFKKKPNIYSYTLFCNGIFAKRVEGMFKQGNHTILSSNSMNFKCVCLHGKCDSWMENERTVSCSRGVWVSFACFCLVIAPRRVCKEKQNFKFPSKSEKQAFATDEQTKKHKPPRRCVIVYSCKVHTYSYLHNFINISTLVITITELSKQDYVWLQSNLILCSVFSAVFHKIITNGFLNGVLFTGKKICWESRIIHIHFRILQSIFEILQRVIMMFK